MSKHPPIKRRKTFTLRLTKFELLHLRDLFNVSLPPDAKKTISQALAESEERMLVESYLWKKIGTACVEAELPLEDDAPDFMVAITSVPSMGVFMVAQQPDDLVEQQSEAGLFKEETSEEK